MMNRNNRLRHSGEERERPEGGSGPPGARRGTGTIPGGNGSGKEGNMPDGGKGTRNGIPGAAGFIRYI